MRGRQTDPGPQIESVTLRWQWQQPHQGQRIYCIHPHTENRGSPFNCRPVPRREKKKLSRGSDHLRILRDPYRFRHSPQTCGLQRNKTFVERPLVQETHTIKRPARHSSRVRQLLSSLRTRRNDRSNHNQPSSQSGVRYYLGCPVHKALLLSRTAQWFENAPIRASPQ